MSPHNDSLASRGEQVHVFLHDGMLRRVGELGAHDVSRSYLLGRAGSAEFSVPDSDPLLSRVDPDVGATVVIESESYAAPWVGVVSALSGTAASSSVRVSCTDYSVLLEERYLPNRFQTSGALADEFRRIVDTINQRNATLIRLGAVEDQPVNVSDLRLSNMTAWAALDLLAGVGLMEWYLEYGVEGGVVDASINLVDVRGSDLSQDVQLSTGPTGNAILASWTRRAGALPAIGHLVGGNATGSEPFDQLPRATVVSGSGAGRGLLIGRESQRPPTTVHGYRRFTEKVGTPATRIESLVYLNQGLSPAAALVAAQASVSRPTFAERTAVIRLLNAEGLSTMRVGDTVSASLTPGASGVPGLAPVRAVRLMTVTFDARVQGMALECELLGGRP